MFHAWGWLTQLQLSILPDLLPGHLVSDVGAILGSFDFVQGECDR